MVYGEINSTIIKIPIVGDGEQRRDFTHVVDICDVLYKVGVGNENTKTLGSWERINYSVMMLTECSKRSSVVIGCIYPTKRVTIEKPGENNDMLERLELKPEDRLKEYIDSLRNNLKIHTNHYRKGLQ